MRTFITVQPVTSTSTPFGAAGRGCPPQRGYRPIILSSVNVSLGIRHRLEVRIEPMLARNILTRLIAVPHASNYAFQFGTEEPEDPALATAIMDYWLSFATSLIPNDGLGSERPNWPVYDADNEVCIGIICACVAKCLAGSTSASG